MTSPFVKASSAELDYPVDWGLWLDGDTITGYDFVVPDGLELIKKEVADGITVAWLGGGTDGRTYEVEASVETAAGRKEYRIFRLKIGTRREN